MWCRESCWSLAFCAFAAVTGGHAANGQSFVFDTRSMAMDGSWNSASTAFIGGAAVSGQGGIPHDTQLAMPFTLLSKTKINRVVVDMTEYISGDGNPSGGFLVEVFPNIAGNHPAETPAFSVLVPPASVTFAGFFVNSLSPVFSTSNVPGDRGTWSLDVSAGSTTLNAGSWWISVQAKNDGDPFGSTFSWVGNYAISSGAPVHFRCGGLDHGNNYPCASSSRNRTPDWTPLSTVTFADPQTLSVRIEGDVLPGVALYTTGAPVISDTGGNGNGNGNADPGESAIGVSIPLYNAAADTVNGVTATLTSLTPTATIVTGTAVYPSVGHASPVVNSTPFVISLSPSHPCGAPVNLQLTVSAASDLGPGTFNVSFNSGSPTPAIVTSWTGSVPIPDSDPVGATQTIVLSGITNPIGKVAFRFDGTAPDTHSPTPTSPGSTTVGITEAIVGDLVATLTSPQGTTVILLNRPGQPPSYWTGYNIWQLTLDDSATASLQSINGGTPAPLNGLYQPASPLSAFNGENANGTWILNVADVSNTYDPNGGSLLGFSVIVTNNAQCAAPAVSNGACCAGTSCTLVASAGACGGSFQGVGVACAAPGTPAPCCRADFNGSGTVTVQDIFDFLSAWFVHSPSADFNKSGSVTVQDIFDFLSAWFVGCH